jgi:hypothetical protein
MNLLTFCHAGAARLTLIFPPARALNYTTELILKMHTCISIYRGGRRRQALPRPFHLKHAANRRIFVAA